MKYVLLGKVVSTHGIKGEIKIKSDTSFKEERYQKGNTLYFKKDNTYVPFQVDSFREHKSLDLVRFDGHKDINEVLEYVGLEVYVNYNDIDSLEDDSYYYDDLITLEVYTMENVLVGTVKEIREVPQGIILEVQTKEKTVLIPFVEEFIKDVDLEKKKIFIQPIEGLL